MKSDSKPSALPIAIFADAVGVSIFIGVFMSDARWSDIFTTLPSILVLLCGIGVSVIGATMTFLEVRDRYFYKQ